MLLVSIVDWPGRGGRIGYAMAMPSNSRSGPANSWQEAQLRRSLETITALTSPPASASLVRTREPGPKVSGSRVPPSVSAHRVSSGSTAPLVASRSDDATGAGLPPGPPTRETPATVTATTAAVPATTAPRRRATRRRPRRRSSVLVCRMMGWSPTSSANRSRSCCSFTTRSPCPRSVPLLSPSSPRSRSRPRALWLFTVPVDTPRSAAACSTDRSSQNRRTTTLRWPSGRAARARRRASRSSLATPGAASESTSWCWPTGVSGRRLPPPPVVDMGVDQDPPRVRVLAALARHLRPARVQLDQRLLHEVLGAVPVTTQQERCPHQCAPPGVDELDVGLVTLPYPHAAPSVRRAALRTLPPENGGSRPGVVSGDRNSGGGLPGCSTRSRSRRSMTAPRAAKAADPTGVCSQLTRPPHGCSSS